MITYEEDYDEDGDEPVGENDAELDADGDTEHEHGLEEQRELVVDDGCLLGGVGHLEVVPHGRRRGPHNHACAQNQSSERSGTRVTQGANLQMHASKRGGASVSDR